MQRKCWDKLPSSANVHSFLLACSFKEKNVYVDDQGKALWNEAAKDIRAQLSTQQKKPRSAFSVYMDTGELLYWMHPRDAFIIKLVFLENCHGLKDVSYIIV